MTDCDYELLQNTLRHNRPKGDRVYGPCPRQVEGYDKACRVIAHALSHNDPKFSSIQFLKQAGVATQPNEIACLGWACPYCGTVEPQQHALNCDGLKPEVVALRRALGQPWPTDQLGADHGS